MSLNRRMLDELAKKEEKTPLLINMIAQRVKQIYRGDKPMIDDRQVVESVDIAVKEFLEGKLTVKKGRSEK